MRSDVPRPSRRVNTRFFDARSRRIDARRLSHLASWLALLLLGALIALRLRAWTGSIRMRRRMRRAIEGERSARGLLERAGFFVVGEQVRGVIVLRVDGAASEHALRADYLVSRGGRRFVVEVKTGALAPSLEHAPTRRQILEYCTAFDVDGALLVDADRGQVREIAVPRRAAKVWPWIAIGLTAGLAIDLLAR
jgi:hypothetical protein